MSNLFSRDGLSRGERVFPELSQDYLKVDGRCLPEILNRMKQFSEGAKCNEIFRRSPVFAVASFLSLFSEKSRFTSRAERVVEILHGLSSLQNYKDCGLLAVQAKLSFERFKKNYKQRLSAVVKQVNDPVWQQANDWLERELSILKPLAEKFFESLLNSGVNDPAVSIYIATAVLFRHAQNILNTFPDRRTSFYYEKILKASPENSVPDRVNLVFAGVPEGVSETLSAGVRFVGGKDSEGEEIVFETKKSCQVNGAKVAKILTLSVGDNTPAVTREIPVYDPNDFPFEKEQTPYPLFGMNYAENEITGDRARLGLAIASEIFHMENGERKVRLQLLFDPETVKGSVLEKGSSAFDFVRIFSDAFDISLTSEKGWYKVSGYNLDSCVLGTSDREAMLGLSFTISRSGPVICAYDPGIHETFPGEVFETKSPLLKLEVRSDSRPNPWNILRRLHLRRVVVETEVSECRNLSVSNDFGPLSVDAPFMPLGPIPAKGSSFIVGSTELAGKRITSFKINASWFFLPSDLNDISLLYAGYPEPPRTCDFTVAIQTLAGGTWLPSEREVVITEPLFGLNSRGHVSNHFMLSFDRSLGMGDFTHAAPEQEYSAASKNGFFRMKLLTPSSAFGHANYATALSDALSQRVLKKKAELPKEPYTPQFEGLSANYRAEATIRVDGGGDPSGVIFRLHPFGVDRKVVCSESGGSLFIGLTGVKPPETISLFFHLNRDSAPTYENACGEFSWFYLGLNGWTKIPGAGILGDTTACFTQSGIVTLALPAGMTSEHSRMPKGFLWLRLLPGKAWKQCCRLFSIYAGGVEASRVGGKECGDKIPKGTLREVVDGKSGICAVCQPSESFGGKPAESKEEMRTRMAETLYSHGRCVSAADYERAVLARFHGVAKVKCFPATDPEKPGKPAPGHVLVVPLSPLIGDGRFQWNPRLRGGTLGKIKDFLNLCAPTSAKIDVRNPFFEKVQVRCSVLIKKGFSEIEKLEELNRTLNEYISPWYPFGNTRHFGWKITEVEVKKYVQSLDYIESVEKLSLFQIAPQSDCTFDADKNEDGVCSGSCPWSVPVPIRRHYINCIDPANTMETRSIMPGYGDLEIGSTFIIQAK